MEMALAKYQGQLLSILRIVSGFVFLQHGTVKWLSFPAAHPAAGSGSFQSMSGVGGVFELIGGVLIILGLFTRPVAFLLSGEMAIAYFWAHNPRSFFPIINLGEAAILFCFVFLFIAAAGPGPWSLDAMMRRKG